MTPILVRVKVRCDSCHTSFRLNQEQYCELVKRSRVALTCPHCANGFEYSPVAAKSAAKPAPSPRPRRLKAEAQAKPAPARPAPELPPPEEVPVSAPEFPPPPFAPLGVGTPAPFHADPPPFTPLGGKGFSPPAATPSPKGTVGSPGGEAKQLTLNERWKQLPLWVQWTVIGVLIVVLTIIFFAVPTGGGTAPPAPETPKAQKQSHDKAAKDHPHADNKSIPDEKPDSAKPSAGEEKKPPATASGEASGDAPAPREDEER